MFGYQLHLALRNLPRNPALTALMVLALGLGIGASMTMLTVMHLLSGDPLPHKSAQLYIPQLDPQDKLDTQSGDEPPDLLTYIDAMNLLQARRADRQAVMLPGTLPLRPEHADAFYADARYASADFFPMFEVPFVEGGPWSAADDEARANVVVITSRLRARLFGGESPVGRSLRIGDHDLRIIGVLGDWNPRPRFYDLNAGNGRFGDSEDLYIPFTTAHDLKLATNGSVNCWGNNINSDHLETSPCVWVGFWVELDTPDKAAAYKDYLMHYSQEQKAAGRFQLSPNVRLRSLLQWLDYQHVVPSTIRLQSGLALGFLLVCLVNTIGLLLAKFLRRSAETSVRRALGATRAEIFGQFLIEATAIGAAGGLLGLLLTLAGLWLMRLQPASYSDLVHLDLPMFLATFALALVASLLAGVLPAWRACSLTPALQLKAN